MSLKKNDPKAAGACPDPTGQSARWWLGPLLLLAIGVLAVLANYRGWWEFLVTNPGN